MNARPLLKLRNPTEAPAPTPALAPVVAAPPVPKVPTPAQLVLAESRRVSAEKFWFVACLEERYPKRRHGSLESAQTEQRRLSALAPEKTFRAYECTLVPPESPPVGPSDI